LVGWIVVGCGWSVGWSFFRVVGQLVGRLVGSFFGWSTIQPHLNTKISEHYNIKIGLGWSVGRFFQIAHIFLRKKYTFFNKTVKKRLKICLYR